VEGVAPAASGAGRRGWKIPARGGAKSGNARQGRLPRGPQEGVG
jgi:hypothetical protein